MSSRKVPDSGAKADGGGEQPFCDDGVLRQMISSCSG